MSCSCMKVFMVFTCVTCRSISQELPIQSCSARGFQIVTIEPETAIASSVKDSKYKFFTSVDITFSRFSAVSIVPLFYRHAWTSNWKSAERGRMSRSKQIRDEQTGRKWLIAQGTRPVEHCISMQLFSKVGRGVVFWHMEAYASFF
jgi:hypothetical protein